MAEEKGRGGDEGGGGGGGGRCTPLLIAVLNGFLDNITVKLPLSANGPLSVTGLIFCHVTKINFFPILVFDLDLQLLELKSAKRGGHSSPKPLSCKEIINELIVVVWLPNDSWLRVCVNVSMWHII